MRVCRVIGFGSGGGGDHESQSERESERGAAVEMGASGVRLDES